MRSVVAIDAHGLAFSIKPPRFVAPSKLAYCHPRRCIKAAMEISALIAALQMY